MISADACDLCARPLGRDLTKLDIVRGSVFTHVNRSWGIATRPSGLQHYTICQDCSSYLRDALQHLRQLVGEQQDRPGAEDQRYIA